MSQAANQAEADAKAQREQGWFEQSLQSFQRAVDLTEDEAGPHRRRRMMLLGEAYAFLGRHRKAARTYGHVLKDKSRDVVYMATCTRMCALLLTQGRVAEARERLVEAEFIAQSISADDPARLDVRFHVAAVLEAEGRNREACSIATELVETSDTSSAGLARWGYSQLLLARAALVDRRIDDAIAITTSLQDTAGGRPELRQIAVQATHVAGEALLAGARFAEAVDSFRRCIDDCGSHPGARPALLRVRAEARLSLAGAMRARGQARKAFGILRSVLGATADLEDAETLQARCLLSLGLSHLDLAIASNERSERRHELAHARSALQEAAFLSDEMESGQQLTVRVLGALAYVQRALGRPRQADTTLARAELLVNAADVVASIDRADHLAGRGIAQIADAAADPAALDGAADDFRLARTLYEDACSWYDLARIDQNLAVVEFRRAGLEPDGAKRTPHFEAAMDLLVPALLAKFAVRFTFASKELRREWVQGQVRGFTLALDIAENSNDERMVADLVLTSRIHGTLTPPSDADLGLQSDDSKAVNRQRLGRFATASATRQATASVADILGMGDQPSVLVPSPRLIGPDGRVVLAAQFDRAVDRYGPHGLPADRIRQTGAIRL